MKSCYYIFDMDGTLFFTDELNNESYNLALVKNNFNPINNAKRITREVVRNFYPEISEQNIAQLIMQKQGYFINNISKVRRNDFLFDILRRAKRNKCILWTSADRVRVESLIKYFCLHRFFIKTIFSDKKNISDDIDNICSEFTCTNSQLLAFENDISIAKKLSENQVSCYLLVSQQ